MRVSLYCRRLIFLCFYYPSFNDYHTSYQMKQLHILLLIGFISLGVFTETKGQNTFSVNPNPVAQADFQSLQTAIDSVAAGSILMVHGGSYGNITLHKTLVIIGPGYFLGQNPQTQSTPIPATVGTANIDSSAAGSYISGMTFEGHIDLHAPGTIFQRVS